MLLFLEHSSGRITQGTITLEYGDDGGAFDETTFRFDSFRRTGALPPPLLPFGPSAACQVREPRDGHKAL